VSRHRRRCSTSARHLPRPAAAGAPAGRRLRRPVLRQYSAQCESPRPSWVNSVPRHVAHSGPCSEERVPCLVT
jgi:hypothetical protein